MINRDLSSPCFIYRYDVELYQRIEQLIGKKLPLYPTVEEEVMLLMERVTEAQRYAKMVRIPPHLTPYIQVCLYVTCVCSWKNRFYVAALLFSNKTQMTSKLGRNKKVKHEAEPRSFLIERFSFAFQWNVSGKGDHDFPVIFFTFAACALLSFLRESKLFRVRCVHTIFSRFSLTE